MTLDRRSRRAHRRWPEVVSVLAPIAQARAKSERCPHADPPDQRRGSWRWRRCAIFVGRHGSDCGHQRSDAIVGLCIGRPSPLRRPSVGLLIAIRQPRNVIAWIMLVGALSSAPFYVLHPGRGLGAAMQSRALAVAVCVADRARVRVSERAPPHAPLAPGRDRRRGVLRRIPVRGAGRPGAVRSAGSGGAQPDGRLRLPGLARVDLGSALARHPRQPDRRGDRDPAAPAPFDGRRAAADALGRMGCVPDPARAAHVLCRLGARHSLCGLRPRSDPAGIADHRSRPPSASRSSATGSTRSSAWSTEPPSTAR